MGRGWRGGSWTRAPTQTPCRATRWPCGRSTPRSPAGSGAVALALIAAGADPGARQQHGWTPLHGAADNGLGDVVEALLAAGADPAATNDDGATARSLAENRGHAAIVDRLRAAGG